MKKIFILALLLITTVSVLTAQLSVGVDFKSRYVWRGLDFGNSPSIQPSISYSFGMLTVGMWGAYSYPAGIYAENDFWASVDIPTSSGTISAIVTDYTFPSSGIRLGDFSDNGSGAHTLELGVQYVGPESMPIALRAFVNVYNDPDNSMYVEASYPFAVDDVEFSATIGASAYESAAYATTKFGIINVSLSATKSVAITDKFSLPVSTTIVFNPRLEQATLIFGLTL